MKVYLITAPRSTPKKALKIMIEKNDCKKWIIGWEKGKNGYEHFQIRVETSNDNFFAWVKYHIPQAHIEESNHQFTDQYERKEGRFISASDTNEIRKVRYGKPRHEQKAVIEALRHSNDREIVVWYDPKGNSGKSWLACHLWETGQAHICQSQDNVKGMIQDIASDYMNNGYRPYLVIDIPRTWKWTDDLCCAIERAKDGLIKDTRYNAKTIDIRGVKILVCTNSMPKLTKLSADRWVIKSFERT
ncbi:replication-associated protein [Capybara associated smacovirus 1_cap1_104]|uniref:Replication-associated protein n=1 Tax=Capybara associated smacovirus 1_cap1_104 TaxID=2585076 RepID=A0A514TS08_9VIRU|nr:replication-associated protein [Capybara associated smacovirus 1_cap1_104]QDJ95283.1 replication-associated protein [Capybara associated smacovirus 1_cap1_104]